MDQNYLVLYAFKNRIRIWWHQFFPPRVKVYVKSCLKLGQNRHEQSSTFALLLRQKRRGKFWTRTKVLVLEINCNALFSRYARKQKKSAKMVFIINQEILWDYALYVQYFIDNCIIERLQNIRKGLLKIDSKFASVAK